MKMMNSIMLSCEKATFLVSKREEGKLSPGERIRVAFHLLMCRFCRAFQKQSGFISRTAKNITPAANLTPEDKLRFQKSLEELIQKFSL